ncbi:hypothetical protein A6R68_09265, partial [Neotoma lepida]
MPRVPRTGPVCLGRAAWVGRDVSQDLELGTEGFARYVLLKERNMLLTLEQEAKRQRLPMPSPERLEK